MVAVEGSTGGQEVAELLGGEGSSALVAEDLFGVEARLGWLHLADRIGGDQVFLAGCLQDTQQDGAAGHHPGSAANRLTMDNSGHERLANISETAGRRTYSFLTSGGGDSRSGVRISYLRQSSVGP